MSRPAGTTSEVRYLTCRTDRTDAWEQAEDYAAIVRALRLPWAVGVRWQAHLAGWEVYAVPAEVPAQRDAS